MSRGNVGAFGCKVSRAGLAGVVVEWQKLDIPSDALLYTTQQCAMVRHIAVNGGSHKRWWEVILLTAQGPPCQQQHIMHAQETYWNLLGEPVTLDPQKYRAQISKCAEAPEPVVEETFSRPKRQQHSG